MTNKEITFIIKARNAAKAAFAELARDIRAAAKATQDQAKASKDASRASDGFASAARKAASAVKDAAKAGSGGGLKKPFVDASKEVEHLSNGVGQLRAMLGGLTVGAGIGAGVKMYADFTREMSVFGAVTKASEADLQKATMAARQLGLVSEASATDAAQAMTVFARKGYSVQESVDAARGALNLMIVSGSDMATVAQVMSEAMNQFDISADNAGKIADIFANLDNISAAGVVDAGEAFSYSGTIAKQAGVDFNTLGAAIGVLADNGTLGSRAGSEMTNVIQSMLNPTDKANKAMHSLGLSMKDLNPTDLAGSMQKLGDAFKSKGLTDQEALSKLFDIFDIRGGRAASVLIQNTEKLRDFDAQLRNSGGTAQTAANQINDNLTGDFRNLMSAVEEAAQAIGASGFGAALRTVVQVANSVVEAIGAMVRWMSSLGPVGNTVFTVIMGLAGGFVTLVGAIAAVRLAVNGLGLLRLVGLAGNTARAVGGITAAFNLAKTAIMGFRLAMLATPWGIAIAAGTALAGALIYLATRSDHASKYQAALAGASQETRDSLETMRQKAIEAVDAEDRLAASGHGAAGGMNAATGKANTFAAALRNLGIQAEYAAVKVAMLGVQEARTNAIKAQGNLATANKNLQGSVGQAALGMNTGLQSKAQQEADAASRELRIQTKVLEQATAKLNEGLRPVGGGNTEFKNPGGLGTGTGMPDEDTNSKAKKAKKGVDEYKKALDDLIKTYLPAKERQKEYSEAMAAAAAALKKGDITATEYATAVSNINAKLGEAGDPIGKFTKSMQDEITVLGVDASQRDALREKMQLEQDAREAGLNPLDADTQKRLQNALALSAQTRAMNAADIAAKSLRDAQQTLADMRTQANIDGTAAGLHGAARERYLAVEEYRANLMSERQQKINDGKEAEALSLERINQLSTEYGTIWDGNYERQQAQRADWMGGLRDGWLKWLDEARNVSGAVSDAVGNILGSLTDMFTNFLMTGKLSFKEFARSAIAEIMKIISKLLLMQAIKAAGSALGLPIPMFHSGGRVGSSGGSGTTRVDPMVFAGAQRFHSGGRIGGLRHGERPIIAKVGERVLNEDENRAYEAGMVRGFGSRSGGRRGGRAGDTNIMPNVAVSLVSDKGSGFDPSQMDPADLQRIEGMLKDDLKSFMEDWFMQKMRNGGPLAKKSSF